MPAHALPAFIINKIDDPKGRDIITLDVPSRARLNTQPQRD
ncbi:MAG: hypothetical protein ACRC9V_10950 [Aeromonas sp.]